MTNSQMYFDIIDDGKNKYSTFTCYSTLSHSVYNVLYLISLMGTRSGNAYVGFVCCLSCVLVNDHISITNKTTSLELEIIK